MVDILDKAAKDLETELAGQPERQARLRQTLSETYYSLGLSKEAIASQEKVKDNYLSSYGQEHPDTLTAVGNLAKFYHAVDRRDEALRLGEELVALQHKINDPEHLAAVFRRRSACEVCASLPDRRDPPRVR